MPSEAEQWLAEERASSTVEEAKEHGGGGPPADETMDGGGAHLRRHQAEEALGTAEDARWQWRSRRHRRKRRGGLQI